MTATASWFTIQQKPASYHKKSQILAHCPMVTGRSFLRVEVNQTKHEADYSPQFITEIKNEWGLYLHSDIFYYNYKIFPIALFRMHTKTVRDANRAPLG